MTNQPPPPPRPSQTFDFVRPLAFVFEDPEWVQKILLGGVFVLASIVLIGVFFIYGYLARLVRNVIAGMQHPLPAWDDLGEYFFEGLRLFGVILIYAIPIIAFSMMFVVPMIIMDATNNETLRDMSGMTATCMWCLIFPVSVALAFWLPGALLMAVVDRRMAAAFEFRRIASFIRANAGNYILAFLSRIVAGFIAQFGIMLFCIGIVFTGFWAMLVGAYAFAQTYRLSAQR